MISIVLYNLSKSFYEYNPGADVVYVAPGPVYADALRSNLRNPNAEVTTMAQFLLGHLTDYSVTAKKNYQSKSQLLLTLGLAWRQLQIGNFAQFKNAFMLLTDLRGYTQDKVLLESLLEEFDPTLGEIVLKMNSLIEGLEIMDEHSAYWHLTQSYDEQAPADSAKTFCFWGFDFLSPVQVDFIKAFSKFNDIIIPIPQEVFENSIQSDWIHWLEESENIVYLDQERLSCQAQVNAFPKGYLSRSLKEELMTGPKLVDIYLASKSINAEEIQSIPSSEHYYKVPASVFVDKLAGIDKAFKQRLQGQTEVGRAAFIQTVLTLKKQAIKSRDYISLKVYEIYVDVLERWEQLTDSAFIFDWFISELMKEVVALDLPRLSLMPLLENSRGRILSIADLHSLNANCENWLCITGSFIESRSSTSLYSNTTETKLLQIGPLRRSGLEELFTIAKLRELLYLNNSKVFIEIGVREKSQIWHDLLLGVEERLVPLSFQRTKSNPLPEVNVGAEFKLLEITPSKLQGFVNCPRKFYHEYLDGLFPRIKLQKFLSPMHSGELAHNIVETYVKNGELCDIDPLIERHLHTFYENNSIAPDLDVHYEYLAQLRLKTLPISRDLLNLKLNSKGNFIFEKKIENTLEQITRKGRCDVFFECDDFQMLIDFKSSAFGVPHINEMSSYEYIQLWFYLSLFETTGKIASQKPLFLGYVNLTQPEKSLILKIGDGEDPVWLRGVTILGKYYNAQKSLGELLSEYRLIEQTIIDKIQQERKFEPKPLHEDVCTYCAIRTICPRGAAY